MTPYDFNPGSAPEDEGTVSGGRCESPSMALASVILAILALVFNLVFYISLPLACLAIVLGLLSRGSSMLAGRARIGVITACVAIAINLIITAAGALYIWRTPELRNYIRQLYEYYSEYYSGYPEYDPATPVPGTLPGDSEQLVPGSQPQNGQDLLPGSQPQDGQDLLPGSQPQFPDGDADPWASYV